MLTRGRWEFSSTYIPLVQVGTHSCTFLHDAFGISAVFRVCKFERLQNYLFEIQPSCKQPSGTITRTDRGNTFGPMERSMTGSGRTGNARKHAERRWEDAGTTPSSVCLGRRGALHHTGRKVNEHVSQTLQGRKEDVRCPHAVQIVTDKQVGLNLSATKIVIVNCVASVT